MRVEVDVAGGDGRHGEREVEKCTVRAMFRIRSLNSDILLMPERVRERGGAVSSILSGSRIVVVVVSVILGGREDEGERNDR